MSNRYDPRLRYDGQRATDASASAAGATQQRKSRDPDRPNANGNESSNGIRSEDALPSSLSRIGSEHQREVNRRDSGSSGREYDVRNNPLPEKRPRLNDVVDGQNRLPSKRHANSNAPPASNGDDIEWDLLNVDGEEERLREERRKRRLAIVERHQRQASVGHQVTPQPSSPKVGAHTDLNSPSTRVATPLSKDANFELSKDTSARFTIRSDQQTTTTNTMSATDYDPSIDQELNKEREEHLFSKVISDHAPTNDNQQTEKGLKGEDSEYEEVEVSDDEDDVDDMFAIADEEANHKKKKIVRVRKHRPGHNAEESPASTSAATGAAADAALHDGSADSDGYYRITLGERIGEAGRYQVFAILGKGMFSAVVKARDTQQADREVAIKIVRSQESMYKAGIKEIAVLQRLASLDPDDKRHVIRLLGHFEHRKHLCMVFESLSMDLRDVVKRFGKDVGLNLRAVRAYAHQMILALSLMRKAEIMHADLKPDNILVNDAKTTLKVCDLGSASTLSEMEITPYLVSRFYRAPEIILGLPYDCALDVWSIGCTLYELYTGRILFPGKSNNHMLLLVQEVKGKFTTKQIRKGRFSGMHFDDQNTFVVRERDRAKGGGGGGADVLRKVASFNPAANKTDLRSRLLPSEKGLSQADLRLTNNFIDLLDRMLELDPARRITPTQALQHAFFT